MKKNSILLFTSLIISSLFLSCSDPSSSSNGGGTESIAGWYKLVSRSGSYQSIEFYQFDAEGNLINCYVTHLSSDNSSIEYMVKQYKDPDTNEPVDCLEIYKKYLSGNKNPGESDFDCFKRVMTEKQVIFYSESETKSYVIRTDNPESKYEIKTYETK